MAKSKKKIVGMLPRQLPLPLLIIAGVCLVLVGVVAFRALQYKENLHYYTVTAWNPETARGFFDSCTYTAERPGSGISNQAANVYCGCNIDALQAIYKNDEELSQQEKSWMTRGYPAEVLSVLRECAGKAHIPLNI